MDESSAAAADSLMPARSGTWTDAGGPEDTTEVTVLSPLSRAPGLGV